MQSGRQGAEKGRAALTKPFQPREVQTFLRQELETAETEGEALGEGGGLVRNTFCGTGIETPAVNVNEKKGGKEPPFPVSSKITGNSAKLLALFPTVRPGLHLHSIARSRWSFQSGEGVCRLPAGRETFQT